MSSAKPKSSLKYPYNKDCSWQQYPQKWMLEKYIPETKIQTYDEYIEFQKKNWPKLNATKTTLEFEKDYNNYLDHHGKFHNVCKEGEIINFIITNDNIAILSKNNTGIIKDHVDIQIYLRKSKESIISLQSNLTGELYSFGTIGGWSGDDDLSKLMIELEGPASKYDQRVSHYRGQYEINVVSIFIEFKKLNENNSYNKLHNNIYGQEYACFKFVK